MNNMDLHFRRLWRGGKVLAMVLLFFSIFVSVGFALALSLQHFGIWGALPLVAIFLLVWAYLIGMESNE